MTTQLCLIHHGTTKLTADDRFSGSTDVELSDLGRYQVQCLANRLVDDHIVAVKATIRLLISSLLGFDPRGYRDRLDQSPACLNVLDFKDPVHARLIVFNDVLHYIDQPPRADGRLPK